VGLAVALEWLALLRDALMVALRALSGGG